MLVLTIILSIFMVGCGASNNSKKVSEETSSNGKLKVYTSFYAMYDFATKIGGDKVEVTNLVAPGVEPHDWEPKPADIVNLEKADVFIYNGLGMEHWTDKVLKSLKNDKILVVEASKGANLIKSEHNHEHDDEEDKHEENEYDPHVWLSPSNAKIELENIKNAFIEADVENKDYYENNYKKYVSELDSLDKKFKEELSNVKNKEVIVAHEAFGYLCREYGLTQVAIEGLMADSEPTAARMAEIIDFAKEHKIKVIFFEELVNPSVAETIAKSIGAKTEVLNPLEGITKEDEANGEDYISIMTRNLNAIKAALE